MLCKDCIYSKLITVDDTGFGEAKCYAVSKKGKVITWAATICGGESGVNRVIDAIHEQNLAPYWCPIRKGLLKTKESE